MAEQNPSSSSSPGRVRPLDSIVKRRSVIIPLLVVLILVLVTVAFFLTVSHSRRSDLLVTVNGEPIYAADIDDTIRLLAPQYQTTATRDSFINQTIDLILLKQEAKRRGITVSQHDIDTRIETLLNDTGRSPQELRILLGDRNLSMIDYQKMVADGLLVEKLTQETVTNRITVSEQEILTYYQTHQSEFLPPENGVRISHILVANESAARTIIAHLNAGESFRMLAQKFSLDAGSTAAGGSLGIVTASDGYPPAFMKAALALAQNQYTNVPVKTDFGYHIILRNFDVPDVQEARSTIQQKLLGQKQRDGFSALINGLHASATITFYTANGAVSAPKIPSIEAFAACVGTHATLYGASWSNSSRAQEQLFGSAASLLSVVDCTVRTDVCSQVNIQKYPTWMIGGKPYGPLTLTEIAEKTGCKAP